MTGMTKHVSLVVVAALAMLFTVLAAPAPAQSTKEKGPHIGAQASDDASLISKGRQRAASPRAQTVRPTQDNSAAKAKRATTKRVTNKPEKTQGSSQRAVVRRSPSMGGQVGKASAVSSRSQAGKASAVSSRSSARDVSKIKSLSIADQTKVKPVSLGNQSPSGPSGIGGLGVKTAPGPTGGTAAALGKSKAGDPRVTTTAGDLGVKTAPDLGIKTAPGLGIKTAPAPTGGTAGILGKPTAGDPRVTTTAGDLGIKTAPGLGIKTAPGLGIKIPPGLGIKLPPGKGGTDNTQGDVTAGGTGTTAPGQGGTTNTQGDVTGGGPGSVTTGGVQSGGGEGSQTQGGTVSTGGGNTVGGIQQSGDNNTVNIDQTSNTANTTNVTNISAGGFGGGGGGVAEVPAVDVSPIDEYEPEPVAVTRVVRAASPTDSCPTVVELNQLGFSYYQAGTYTSAEDAFKRALQLLDSQACKNIPLKATTLENLAFTFEKLGKHDDGVKYQEQAQLLRRMQ